MYISFVEGDIVAGDGMKSSMSGGGGARSSSRRKSQNVASLDMDEDDLL
jgi:hypothetical protein